MKFLQVFLISFLVACGGGGGGSSDSSSASNDDNSTSCTTDPLLVGSWANTELNETLTFASNCTVQSDYCGSTITVSQTTSEKEVTTAISATVVTTNGLSDCLPKGSYTCVYQRWTNSGERLSFTCGNYEASHYTEL
jgi:hypothetical protein